MQKKNKKNKIDFRKSYCKDYMDRQGVKKADVIKIFFFSFKEGMKEGGGEDWVK